MAALPPPLHTLPAAIYRWWEEQADDGLRPHLGASIVGHPCQRYLWASFRWVAKATFEGRVLRLFDRGQREEAVIVRELRGIGAEVSECQADGSQWRVESFGGHFGGSLDGVARNLPGGSKEKWELLEFKTHNKQSFKDLCAKGVKESKPQHFSQMQTYLKLTGMERANYLAVCKDDDQLYYERIHADHAEGERCLERARQVIFSDEPPLRISNDPSWYQCQGCTFYSWCHVTQAPLANCRTCAHSTPMQDGGWHCERMDESPAPLIPLKLQRVGCSEHRYIPQTLLNFAELVDANHADNWCDYRLISTGARFMNSTAPDGYSSEEIYACQDKALLGEEMGQAIKAQFSARLVA